MSWSSHVDSWTIGNKDVLTSVVRYEDLANEPNKTWPKVLKALGIEVDRQRLKKAREVCEFDKLQTQESDKGFRENGKGERFFRRGKAGGWRDELTTEQVKRIEKNHRGSMMRWGYLEANGSRRNTLGRVQSVAVGSVK